MFRSSTKHRTDYQAQNLKNDVEEHGIAGIQTFTFCFPLHHFTTS